MRASHAPKSRSELRYRRHLRVRKRVAGSAGPAMRGSFGAFGAQGSRGGMPVGRTFAAQQAHLADWLSRERAESHADEYLRLVREVRAAQVEASIAALDDVRRYSLQQAA